MEPQSYSVTEDPGDCGVALEQGVSTCKQDNCRSCGTMTGESAEVCPGCGARRSSGKPKRSTVAALLGVTALVVGVALGISAYQDHGYRATVLRVIHEIQLDIGKIEAFALREKRFPVTIAEAGIGGNLSNEQGWSTVISHRGVMTVTLGNAGGDALNGQTLVWVPGLRAGTVHWDCSGGTLPAEYRNPACRVGIYSGEQSPASSKWIASGKGLARILVPNSWEPLPVPAGQGVTRYGNAEREHYLEVRSESRQDHAAGMELSGYSELLIARNYVPGIENLSITFLGAVDLNGMKGLKYELRGQVDGVNSVQLAIAAQGVNHFHQVVFRTRLERWSETAGLYESALASFAECDPGCGPLR